jgi:hypothetical protein
LIDGGVGCGVWGAGCGVRGVGCVYKGVCVGCAWAVWGAGWGVWVVLGLCGDVGGVGVGVGWGSLCWFCGRDVEQRLVPQSPGVRREWLVWTSLLGSACFRVCMLHGLFAPDSTPIPQTLRGLQACVRWWHFLSLLAPDFVAVQGCCVPLFLVPPTPRLPHGSPSHLHAHPGSPTGSWS